MDMPRSSLLGRLEAFLPEMEKANRETNKLAQEGKLEVIDKKLEVASPEDLREPVDGTDPEDDGEDDQSVEEELSLREDGGESAVRPRIVQLDFALGDFDDTPIAKMEGEKEAAAGDRALHATAVADCEDGAAEGTEKEAIPSLILMPGARARKEPVGEASTKNKSCKPLIEEL